MATLINEACGSAETKFKNIGGKEQCFEGLVKTGWLADDSFSFANVAAMRTAVAALAAVQAKKIIPLPYLENPAANNTEAQVKNGAWRDYVLKEGVPGVTHRIDTAICTHDALKSYENSKYSRRIFEITDKNEILCDIQEDGTVKGRKMTSFSIGIRNQRTAEDVPFTNITIKYENDTPSVIKANWDAPDVEGIYDVVLVQESASATSIKFMANSHCSGTSISSLEEDDIVLKNAVGAVQTIGAFTEADANGVYTITGTGFTSGYTLEINGVVAKGNMHYEGVEPLEIVVT